MGPLIGGPNVTCQSFLNAFVPCPLFCYFHDNLNMGPYTRSMLILRNIQCHVLLFFVASRQAPCSMLFFKKGYVTVSHGSRPPPMLR